MFEASGISPSFTTLGANLFFNNFTTEFTELAEPDNPLGVKGAGEGPTSGSVPAFMNALRDALGPHAGPVDMPATPEAVWRALSGQSVAATAASSAIPSPRG